MAIRELETLVIGGERLPAAEGRSYSVVNPANNEHPAEVAEGGAQEIDRAVVEVLLDHGAEAPEDPGALRRDSLSPLKAPRRNAGRRWSHRGALNGQGTLALSRRPPAQEDEE